MIEEWSTPLEDRAGDQDIDISPLGMEVLKDALSRGMENLHESKKYDINKKLVTSMYYGNMIFEL